MNEKTKKLIPVIFLMIVAIAFMATNLINGRKDRNAEEENPQQDTYAELPDAETTGITESKSDAYMSSRSSTSIEDYWDNCDTGNVLDDGEITGTGGDSQGCGTSVSSEALFGASQPPERTQSSQGASVYRETAEEREARHQRRREEAIEMALAMQQGSETDGEGEEGEEAMPKTERITVPSGSIVRGSVISSLDDGWDSGGISTLGNDDAVICGDDDHPYRCMFLRDEKIKSGGRVSIRLLEDMAISGTVIPKNTHLMASCSIGARLTMEITSIEMNGDIYPMGYEAYDMDGSKGIYCPETGQAAGTARSRGTTMLGSTLSSQVGRLASDIVNTGISIVHSAGGETTVSVPSGYTFFIVKKKSL